MFPAYAMTVKQIHTSKAETAATVKGEFPSVSSLPQTQCSFPFCEAGMRLCVKERDIFTETPEALLHIPPERKMCRLL